MMITTSNYCWCNFRWLKCLNINNNSCRRLTITHGDNLRWNYVIRHDWLQNVCQTEHTWFQTVTIQLTNCVVERCIIYRRQYTTSLTPKGQMFRIAGAEHSPSNHLSTYLTMTLPHLLVPLLWLCLANTIAPDHIESHTADPTPIQGDLQTTVSQALPSRSEIVVLITFKPPVLSFNVPYPDNATWTACGQFAFVLQILCERLKLRAIIDSSAEIDEQIELYAQFERFKIVVTRFLRLFETENYIHDFNQR